MSMNNLLECSHCNHVFKHSRVSLNMKKSVGRKISKFTGVMDVTIKPIADSLLRHKCKCNGLKETAKCMECFKEFARNADLINHIKTHEKNSYKCQSRGKTYTRVDHFENHQAKCPSNNSVDALLFTCNNCDKSFKKKQNLTKHMVVPKF